MNIKINKNSVLFKDIEPGEVFEYKGAYLMKLKTNYRSDPDSYSSTFNAIVLSNANTETFGDFNEVTRITNCSLVIDG